MKLTKIIGTVVALCLSFVPVAQAMDDWELQQRQLDMQMKLQEQQMKQQMQEIKLQMQIQKNDFKQMQTYMRQQIAPIEQSIKFPNEQAMFHQTPMKLQRFNDISFNQIKDIQTQIRAWEINNKVTSSHSFIGKLFDKHGPDAANRDAMLNIGREITNAILDNAVQGMFTSYVQLASAYRGYAAASANRIADTYRNLAFNPDPIGNLYSKSSGGIYAPRHSIWFNEMRQYRDSAVKLSQPNLVATATAQRAFRIYNAISTITNTGMTILDISYKTIDYIGRSMQIINPPTPGTRITFPDMGLKPGHTTAEGLHNLKTWVGDFTTNRIRPVQFESTKIINLDNNINLGNTRITRSGFLRETQITVTPTNSIERFMLKLYPVGSYFDPMTSTVTSTRQWSITTRETTMPGASFNSAWNNPISSLPKSNFNTFTPNFNTFTPNFGSPRTNIPNIQIPDIKLPDINTRFRGF